jgi:hypothetical protein
MRADTLFPSPQAVVWPSNEAAEVPIDSRRYGGRERGNLTALRRRANPRRGAGSVQRMTRAGRLREPVCLVTKLENDTLPAVRRVEAANVVGIVAEQGLGNGKAAGLGCRQLRGLQQCTLARLDVVYPVRVRRQASAQGCGYGVRTRAR